MSAKLVRGLSKNAKQKNELTIPYFKNILVYLFKYKLYKNFKCNLYQGFNNSIWNGGRATHLNTAENRIITKKIIHKYNSFGITISNTSTGINLKNCLNDSNSNTLLHMLNNKIFSNEIILRDENLLKYLKNYNLITKFSITGHKNYINFRNSSGINRKAVENYYHELFDKYDKVVIHSELALKRWFIEFLIKYKYIYKSEIILNIINGCSYCPKYKEHYDLIATDIFNKVPVSKSTSCILDNVPNKFTDQFYNKESKKLLIQIYYNFKLEGRTLKNLNSFLKIHENDIKIILGG